MKKKPDRYLKVRLLGQKFKKSVRVKTPPGFTCWVSWRIWTYSLVSFKYTCPYVIPTPREYLGELRKYSRYAIFCYCYGVCIILRVHHVNPCIMCVLARVCVCVCVMYMCTNLAIHFIMHLSKQRNVINAALNLCHSNMPFQEFIFESIRWWNTAVIFRHLLSSSDMRKLEKIQYINYRTRDGVIFTYVTPLPKCSHSFYCKLWSFTKYML